MAIVQEFDDSGSRHRLVDTVNGIHTNWAGYRQITYLKGQVGHTAFYGAKEGVVSPEVFCLMAAVGQGGIAQT